MAKTDFRSVDEYLAAQPAAARPVLRKVRAAIRKALPAAEEVISYQIPAYRMPGETLIYFAGWKEHYSLYPATAAVLAAMQDEIAPYVVSKGTIRFPLAQTVPSRLIERVAKLRAKEAAARAKARSAAKPGKATAARKRATKRRA
jgi:uncharacterized protein YdhG (YjbR/CyaY superfamily)